MAVWIVRAGEGGKHAEFARRNRCAVIRFSRWPFDFSGRSQADLRKRFESENTNKAERPLTPGWLTFYAREARDFASVIRAGDIVIVPRKTGTNQVMVGVVCGDYKYVGDAANPETRHRRPLDWRCETMPRDRFHGDAALEEISDRFSQRSGTVFRIKNENAARRIEELLESFESVRE